MAAMPGPSDAKGSDDRFEALYTSNYKAIFGYVLRRTDGDRDTVEDLVAEVFVVALRRQDAIPLPPQDRPWLYGVARRVLLDLQRRRRGRGGPGVRRRGDHHHARAETVRHVPGVLRGVRTGGGPGGPPAPGSTAPHVLAVPLHPAVTAGVIVLAVILAVTGGLLAGAFGSWRIARLRPADALSRVA
jgi:hypothetical protein